MARMRSCRFCDSSGWRPVARVNAAAGLDPPEGTSDWWGLAATGLCVLACVLFSVFLAMLP
jgi:hypothetical protein